MFIWGEQPISARGCRDDTGDGGFSFSLLPSLCECVAQQRYALDLYYFWRYLCVFCCENNTAMSSSSEEAIDLPPIVGALGITAKKERKTRSGMRVGGFYAAPPKSRVGEVVGAASVDVGDSDEDDINLLEFTELSTTSECVRGDEAGSSGVKEKDGKQSTGIGGDSGGVDVGECVSGDDIVIDVGSDVVIEGERTVTSESSRESEPISEPEVVEKSGRKRQRKPEQWHRNIAKKRRNLGKAYVSSKTGKKVASKKIGRPCNDGCFNKVTMEGVQAIHDKYWDSGSYDLQNAYLIGCIKLVPIKRKRTTQEVSKRKHNFSYSVTYNEKKI